MKYDKQRLFEVMEIVNSDFPHKLNEEINIDGLHLSDNELNEILKGYLESAIWTEEERLGDENQSDVDTSGYDDEEGETDAEKNFMAIMRDKLEANPITTFTRENIDYDSLIQAYQDIKIFINSAGALAISEALQENDKFQLGMDIWLTRNGHGAGFFDHSYEHETELMNAAQNLKEVDLYIGDDNKLQFSNVR